jgi:uncharacterized protein
MHIAIISDTHLPRGGRRLPPDCLTRLAGADLIVHAGDLCTRAVLQELESINPVVAVRGNVDDPELQRLLPETAVVPLPDGPEVVVVHDAGPARSRADRLRRRFPTADAVIFGHSHLPLHERTGDGFQIFNPGSATERRRAPRHTMGMARAVAGRIEFELINLGSVR